MEELIKKFNANMNRIRNANRYFKSNQGNDKAEQELQNIINECNDICNDLRKYLIDGKRFDLSKLDMNLT